jgi:Tfp pilus assembly protein PilN
MSHQTINLIPPQIKREQKLRCYAALVNIVFSVVAIMALLIYAALFLTNQYISSALADAKSQLLEQQTKNKELKPVEDAVNSINAKLKKINDLKSVESDWPKAISDINESTPLEVQLTSVLLDRKEKKVSISGFAETRRDIVKLQTKLLGLGYFGNLTFNSSAYNQTDQMYNFTLSGDIVK